MVAWIADRRTVPVVVAYTFEKGLRARSRGTMVIRPEVVSDMMMALFAARVVRSDEQDCYWIGRTRDSRKEGRLGEAFWGGLIVTVIKAFFFGGGRGKELSRCD